MKNSIKLIIMMMSLNSFAYSGSALTNYLFEIRGMDLAKQVNRIEKFKQIQCSDKECEFKVEMIFFKKILPRFLREVGVDDAVVLKKYQSDIKRKGMHCKSHVSCNKEVISNYCEKMDKTTFLSYPFCISLVYTK